MDPAVQWSLGWAAWGFADWKNDQIEAYKAVEQEEKARKEEARKEEEARRGEEARKQKMWSVRREKKLERRRSRREAEREKKRQESARREVEREVEVRKQLASAVLRPCYRAAATEVAKAKQITSAVLRTCYRAAATEASSEVPSRAGSGASSEVPWLAGSPDTSSEAPWLAGSDTSSEVPSFVGSDASSEVPSLAGSDTSSEVPSFAGSDVASLLDLDDETQEIGSSVSENEALEMELGEVAGGFCSGVLARAAQELEDEKRGRIRLQVFAARIEQVASQLKELEEKRCSMKKREQEARWGKLKDRLGELFSLQVPAGSAEGAAAASANLFPQVPFGVAGGGGPEEESEDEVTFLGVSPAKKRQVSISSAFGTPEPKRQKTEESSPAAKMEGAIVLKEQPEAAARSIGAAA